MKIVTYNLHLGGNGKRNHLERLFGELKADIAFVQEALDPKGYDSSFPWSTSLWNPVEGMKWASGIISRGMAIEPVNMNIFRGWVVGGKAVIDGNEILLVNVHNPTNKTSYEKNLNLILDAVSAEACSEMIIGGDFNISLGHRMAAESMKDKPEAIRSLERLEKTLGLVQAWQHSHPDTALAQTLRWVSNPLLPYHCDCFFVGKKLAPKIADCKVIGDASFKAMSDHNPVLLELH